MWEHLQTCLSIWIKKFIKLPRLSSKNSKWMTLEDKKSPDLQPDTKPGHRFLRFEIAESSAVSCLSAFGKIGEILGIPLFPFDDGV